MTDSLTRSSSPNPAAYISDLTWTALTLITLLWSVGVMVLLLTPPLNAPQSIAADRALFTASAAVTSTGFAQGFATPGDFAPHSRWTLIAINLLGTLTTWVVCGVFVLKLLGRPYRIGLFVWPCGVVLLMCVVPAVMGQGPDVLATLTHLGWEFSSPRIVPAVALPLAMIGSIGVAALIAPLLVVRHLPAIRAGTLWSWLAGAFLVSLVIVMGRDVSTMDWSPAGFYRSALHAIELRTSFEPIASLSRAAQWVTLVVTLIGSAPASSAGGFGALALLLVTRGLFRALAGQDDPHRPLFAIACVWIVLTFTLIAIAFFLLLVQAPQLATDRALFIATSSVTGTGLSHDPISLVGPPLYSLSFVMMVAKLLPIIMLGWMARRV